MVLANLICLLSLFSAPDWPPSFYFEHYQKEQGLAGEEVYCIVVGPNGYIWAGTSGGLSRFDGTEFLNFGLSANKSDSFTDDFIKWICAAPSGHLWLATRNGGLLRFNPQSHEIVRTELMGPSGEEVLALSRVHADQHTIWVGGEIQGLIALDLETKEPLTIDSNWLEELVNQKISAIVPGPSSVFVGTKFNGVFELVRDGKRVRVLRNIHEELLDPRVWSLHCDRDNTLWVGTNSGLTRVSPNGDTEFFTKEKNGLGHELVRSITRDANNRLWIGTRGGGLSLLDEVTKSAITIKSNPHLRGSLSETIVTDLRGDPFGNLWVGTYLGGLNKLGRAQEAFSRINHDISDVQSLPGEKVFGIHEDQKGDLWVATFEGLARRKKGEEKFERVDTYFGNSQCMSIEEDGDGNIYVGFDLDVVYVSQGGKPFIPLHEVYPELAESDSRNAISLLVDHTNNLWIGGITGLALKLDLESGKVKYFNQEIGNFQGAGITLIFEDSKGRIWIAAEGMINLYEGDSWTLFQTGVNAPLDTGKINCFAEINKEIWIGTKKGVFIGQLKGKEWVWSKHPNKDLQFTIYSLLTYGDDVWISGSSGIGHLKANGELKLYDETSGIHGLYFGEGVSFSDRAGNIYFGGSPGFTVFKPKNLVERSHQPPIRVSEFKIQNETLPLSNFVDDGVLKLKPNENFIYFKMKALDFVNPIKNLYRGKLLGYDEAWTETQGHCELEYRKLTPGNYTLEVHATDSEGNWNNNPFVLQVTVLPRFYQTWIFKGLMLFLLGVFGHFAAQGVKHLTKTVQHWRKTVIIGPYRVKATIGKGGMGTVYKVAHQSTNKICALKIFDTSFHESRIRRFRQESAVCEQISHPNIVKIFDKGQHESRLYYTMEYCPGKTLREYILGGELSTGTSLMLFRIFVEAIQSVHNLRILHRDLKPENIMLLEGIQLRNIRPDQESYEHLVDHVKILDFGLAKWLGEESITKTGDMLGTVSYLPPEYLGGNADTNEGFDFYSLGIVLYEMLTQKVPYEGGVVMAVIYSIFNKPATPPHIFNEQIPEHISQFCLSIFDKNLEERLTDPDEILARCDEILGLKFEDL